MQAIKTSGKKRTKPEVNIALNRWNSGYMSYTQAIRAAKNCFTDMTNMDLTENGAAKIRPGTIKYGAQPLGKVIGVGTFVRALANQKPAFYQITMQVIDGVGKVMYNIDGYDWISIGGSYDATRLATFTQLNNRVYISNGKDVMSYVYLKTMAIVTYTAVPTPAKPTVTPTGLNSTNAVVTYRIRVSANNSAGETAASLAALVTVNEYRDSWDPSTQYITITTPQVTGAESYNFYMGTVAGEEQYLGNITKPSVATDPVKFVDNNRAAINSFKKAPEGNSTSGPIVNYLSVSDGRLYGTQDPENHWRLWYSGTGDHAGDFSPFNDGGWVDVDYGSDAIPVAAVAFREGQGKSATTILTRGIASSGGLFHKTDETQTIGDYSITYPSIVQANGQSGTYSPMAVVEANNSLYYPSGNVFKTTGSKPSLVNILVTGNISDTIGKDCLLLNLSAMDRAVGIEFDGDIYFCLPVGADHNTEIWKYSIKHDGAWVLRWTIPCDYIWKYEDSSGKVHLCILTNNKILEFSDSALDDDGAPIKTRLAFPTVTFDDSAMQMASIETVRSLLIQPQGKINVSVYGLGEDNEALSLFSSEETIQSQTPIGWDTVQADMYEWDFPITGAQEVAVTQQTVTTEVGETVSQLDIDITTDGNAKYLYNSTLINGRKIPGLYQGSD